jgi:hypothetical protein
MKEPPHTCPLIDEAKRLLGLIQDELKSEDIDRNHIEYLLDTCNEQLEEIRSANERLREWGQWQEDERRKLQDVLSMLSKLEDRLEVGQ